MRAVCGQISWVRRRDWHIISSGLFMYTNDERFQVRVSWRGSCCVGAAGHVGHVGWLLSDV